MRERRGKKSIRGSSVVLVLAIMAAAVILGLSFLIRDISDSRAYDRYMSAAREGTLSGDYDNALASLRKAAQIDATDECLLMMAQCYEAQGNYDRAVLSLRSMSSTSAAVTNKIASIEETKRKQQDAGKITVAGESHGVNDTSLVLDGKGIGNEILPEIAGMYALSSLSLADNAVSDVSQLSSLAGLTSLNLNNNRVTDISSLASLTGLRTLYLDNNPITDLTPLYYLQSLTSLSIKGIQITREALTELSNALPNCAINGAETVENSGVLALGGLTFEEDVTELDLSYRGITDISVLSRCRKLMKLNLCGNAISDISPLMDLPNLNSLNISSNSVTDLRPLMGLTSIKYLSAASNSIYSTVSLGSNTSLLELDLSNNPISDFSGIRKLKNLMTLDLTNTGMQAGDIQYFLYLSRLVSLNIENNPSLTGENVDELQRLIPSCRIRHSDLVYSIQAFGSTVDKNTTEMDLTGQGISDLSFLMQLGSLQSLRLAANNLTNIYHFQYTESWRTLTYLDLSANYISDITAISCLRNLVTLNLSDNVITNITPLYGMDSLRELYLGGNPLTDEQIYELNRNLPNCSIVFR
ncbi:MAG: leucine-rich repeat domain-containing protein [Eubacteriales bacterium]|nr:leucine-rich repeat domain-containing protein [Eubacteriales bacterium]